MSAFVSFGVNDKGNSRLAKQMLIDENSYYFIVIEIFIYAYI